MAEIKQTVFEREALSKSRESGQPILQNVRVEPPVHDYQNNVRQIVTGKRLRYSPSDQKEYMVPFYYYASVPYSPRMPLRTAANLSKDGKPPTVMDFLAAAQASNKLLSFRYAWEMENNWSFALFALGGVVIIGGIWPTILNLLLGAGLGRPPKTEEEKANEEYLKRFGKGQKKSKPVLASKGPTESDLKQLDSMNQALEIELAGAGMSITTAAPPASDEAGKRSAPAAVVALNAEPAQPAPHERQPGETEEEYRLRYAPDDFYPVARSTHAKKE